MTAYLKDLLMKSIEGKYIGKKGFVVRVINVDNSISSSSGRIDPDSGEVLFNIKYEAILFRVFENEVIEGRVTIVSNYGVHCEAGPLKSIFISHKVYNLSK